MSTIDMFNGAGPCEPSLADQLHRLPPTDRVWIDALLEHGATLEAFEDSTVERARLHAAARVGLRWQWVRRFRGARRAWFRPATPDEEREWMTTDLAGVRWLHFHYEPRQEREWRFGPRAKFETDHQSSKRRHWPSSAAP